MRIYGAGALEAKKRAEERFESAWYMIQALRPDELLAFYETGQTPARIWEGFIIPEDGG
jgi:hypothetical protein